MQVPIFLTGGKTGTGLGHTRQFRVAYDAGIGIIPGKGFQQLVEDMLLLLCTGVGSFPVFIQTSFIDNAKGTTVIAFDMNTLYTLGQQRNDISVTPDIVVVAALPVLGFAAGNEVLNAEGLIALIGHAADDDEFDFI